MSPRVVRWWIAALVGFVALAAIVRWQLPRIARLLKFEVELARREVPGATLRFPTGKMLQEKLDYEAGKLEVEYSARERAVIGWTTGELMTVEELEVTLVKPLRETLGMWVSEHGPVQVAGKPGARWLLRGDKVTMIVSVWACGQRWFHLTVAQRRSPATLERSIRDSFECKPDPARDGKESLITVEFDLGPDFGLDEENPLTLLSLDGDGVVVSPFNAKKLPEKPKDDAFMTKAMEGIATTSGIIGTSFTAVTSERAGRTHKVWRGVGTLEGEPYRILSVAIDCGDRRYLAMHMGPQAHTESSALDLLLGARCTKNPKRPLPFVEVARKACARGDQRGCTHRAFVRSSSG